MANTVSREERARYVDKAVALAENAEEYAGQSAQNGEYATILARLAQVYATLSRE